MLQLILGRGGSGKTEYVFTSIKKLIDGGEKNILLITPEQFSFIAERRLLEDLGESRVNAVSNMSFSRLADEVRGTYGGEALPVLSKGAKAVMMKKAIETVSDSLTLFKHNITSISFINSFIRIYDEMKSCRVSVDDILSVADSSDREVLRCKLCDIASIIGAYDALIKGEYLDSADELTRLYEKLLTLDYFKDRYVFIDGFSGFVAQEYKVLEVILKQAKCVYMTLCTDTYKSGNEFDLFSYVNRNIGILEDVLEKAHLKMAEPIFLSAGKRFKTDDLKALENGVFRNIKAPVDYKPEHIKLYKAADISDECDNIALEISKLLRNGYGASDIAVIVRDLNKYERQLAFSFSKFNIPFFDDERQSITSQPLIMLVGFLLRIFIYSYRTEDILSLLKTGLTGLGYDDISSLENYVYLWSINGSRWKNDFTESTKGFVERITDNDKKRIESVNASRKYIIDKLTSFARKVKGKNAKEISKAVYYSLIDFSCDEKLKQLALDLDKSGKSALAEEQGRIWDMLMDILDRIALVGGDAPISLREYYKLFSLMITNEDLGSVPIGLDNVQVGSADRMRCNNPRAVFIAGANEGEFPQSVTSSGLLSESDRAELINNDFKLYSYGETLNAQEKYFAYMAMCAPREKLYVSYTNTDGESVIIREITELFPNIETERNSSELNLDKLESRDGAFELLASNYSNNSVFISSLKSYFEGEEDYSSRLRAINALYENAEARLSDKELAKSLFGKNMYLSASRIEDYYNCSFRYFCKFGLGARPRTKAQLDPMQTGTVIHFVLEQLIKDKGKAGLLKLSRGEVRLLVNSYLKDYLENRMGDFEQFTPRFKYQFMRLSKMLVSVVERLIEEFSQSDFEPCAFELKIGSGESEGEVKSKVFSLENGGTIEINGAVDRVDSFEDNGKKYIRVVDYKSGNKAFALSDILYGLNLQMFIYLFTLSESDSDYAGISGGVLYMHSARNMLSLDRNSEPEKQLKSKENALFKMKGIILNDSENELAKHMERDLKGKYIPAKYSVREDEVTGNIATLAELGYIARRVDKLVINMGNSLQNGEIAQNPVNGKSHDKTCDFCDYRAVCLNKKEIVKNELEEISFDEAMYMLKEDCDA